jgi:hypothetical protein
VLLQLRTLFAGGGSEGSPRAPRQATAPAEIELVPGLSEIACELRGGTAHDSPRRMTTLMNASSTGYLLETRAPASADIAVGELVGLRTGADQPLVLARVVRRVNELNRGIQLGVQLLSDAAWPTRLATFASPDGATEEFIFVPGPDSSGRFDSFAIPYSALKDDVRYQVKAGADEYTLEFNRVHRRGRGWAMAGFEIVSSGKQ